jgi:prepilin-type N-terminal cleavage/methylation domain-containing protein
MPIRFQPFRARDRRRGFSLVEIAVVLVIIAILTTIVALPIATQIEQQRTLETTRQLEAIKEALYGFAIANGRLPCPSLGVNGNESFAMTGNEMNGQCASFAGFLPASALGLSSVDANGLALDAWGTAQNRIRYAVRGLTITANMPSACATGVSNPLTAKDGMRAATMACLSDVNVAVSLISVCAATPTGAPGVATACNGAASTLTVKAPFVVMSSGKNATTAPMANSDEAHNAQNLATFVSRTPSAIGAPGGEFDDIVTWGNLNTLFSRMVQAGRLP